MNIAARLTKGRSIVAVARRAAVRAPYGAVAALAAFHAWLLAHQFVIGRLHDPIVALRWFAALLILAGFLALRRLGFPLVRGRRAVVLWLFVVFLHGHAIVAPAGASIDVAALPGAVTVFVVPAVLGSVVGAIAFLLLSHLARRADCGRHARLPAFVPVDACCGARARYLRQSFVRPPPLCFR